MTKYGSPGWGAHVGIISALLAAAGYEGDTDLFDGEYGFWRYTGYQEWKSEEILANLGREWHSYQMDYKQYPSGY